MSASLAHKVFISYSHEDRDWLVGVRDRLDTLTLLGDQELQFWDDEKIRPGDVWDESIKTALAQATIGILLLGPCFFQSRYIKNVELPLLLEGYRAGRVLLLPIVVRPCIQAWLRELEGVQWVNPPEKPMIDLPLGEQDRILNRLLERILEELEGARDSDGAKGRTLPPALTGPAVSPRLPPAGPQENLTEHEAQHASAASFLTVRSGEHLPAAPTDFAGRREERDAVEGWLTHGARHVLLITGRPRSGKTALFLHCFSATRPTSNAALAGGIYLDCKNTPTRVETWEAQLRAMAEARRPGRDSQGLSLLDLLAQTAPLLVLDNFEALLDAEEKIRDPWMRGFLEDVLRFATPVRVVVLSRTSPDLGSRSADVARVELSDGLPLEEAVELVQSLLGVDATSGGKLLEECLQRVGRSPGACRYLVGYLRDRKGFAPADLVATLTAMKDVDTEAELDDWLYQQVSEDREQRVVFEAAALLRLPQTVSSLVAVASEVISAAAARDVIVHAQRRLLFDPADNGTFSLHPRLAELIEERMEDTADTARLRRAAAEHFEAIIGRVNDEYAGESSYGAMYRFEREEFGPAAGEWIRLVGGLSLQSADWIAVRWSSFFWPAFAWWGEYVPLPLCQRLVDLLALTPLATTDPEFVQLMTDFHRNYPPAGEWRTQGRELTRWRKVEATLEALVLKLESMPSIGKADSQAILGHVCHYLGLAQQAQGQDPRAALQRCRNLFGADKETRYLLPYVDAELAGWHSALGDYGTALKLLRAAWRGGEREEDQEVVARAIRQIGDVFWRLGGKAQSRAYACGRYATWRALHWAHDPEVDGKGEPDAYTRRFYAEQCERLLDRLRSGRSGPALRTAVQECQLTRDFWEPYWTAVGQAPIAFSDAEWVDLLKGPPEALWHELLPPIPGDSDRKMADALAACRDEMNARAEQLLKPLPAAITSVLRLYPPGE